MAKTESASKGSDAKRATSSSPGAATSQKSSKRAKTQQTLDSFFTVKPKKKENDDNNTKSATATATTASSSSSSSSQEQQPNKKKKKQSTTTTAAAAAAAAAATASTSAAVTKKESSSSTSTDEIKQLQSSSTSSSKEEEAVVAKGDITYPIGTTLEKWFDCPDDQALSGMYPGKIVHHYYDDETGKVLNQVKYEDSDQEDMFDHQVQALLLVVEDTTTSPTEQTTATTTASSSFSFSSTKEADEDEDDEFEMEEDDAAEEDEDDFEMEDDVLALVDATTTTTTKTKKVVARAVAVSQKPKQQKKPTTSTKKSSADNKDDKIDYIKTPYTAGDHLPVMTHPQEMFDDMILNNICKNDHKKNLMKTLLQKLKGRPLRLATMCSGTESPLLALDMFQKSIQQACRDDESLGMTEEDMDNIFQLQHVFSCEIEPFKQGYIERNFSPPILFRDIRELGQEQAYTAYGALVDVPNQPGCTDILIAGTSCVDYSNLNNKKKEMEDLGESGATFEGMICWIIKAMPPIVILENVFGAPWDKKVKLFDDLGYSATYLKLDTKDYYIPHTRQRGYLFAILKQPAKKKGMKKIDGRPEQWKSLVKEFKRPASATLDAYLFSNDDPRVLRGRAQLTAESMDAADKKGNGGGNRAGRTDWTRCETRHLAARSFELLGDKRPLTAWSESGNTALPGFFWNDWFGVQVNRIHDLVDINTLRLAKVGVDHVHKPMVWNLSQNVDRDTMGRLGLCQCLTPTGVPYVTTRGGPMVGEELLMLQGIPSDDLLLTKESQDQLKDLSGNAMSTTIVGACAFSALLVGCAALPDRDSDDMEIEGGIVRSLVPRPLAPVSNEIVIHQDGQYEIIDLDLSPKVLPDRLAWDQLLLEASSSARKCDNEGVEECIPLDELVQCKACGQTTSAANTNPPRKFEEHEFAPLDNASGTRVRPSAFRKKLLDFLPMRVFLDGFRVEDLTKPSSLDLGFWKKWLCAFRGTVTSEAGDPLEFRLTGIARTHIWTAVYRNANESRLEVRVSATNVTWLLFAKPRTKKSALKDVLDRPMARMVLALSCVASSSRSTLLDGTWEYCLPEKSAVKLCIDGVGKKVPSWRNRLGLKGDFENEVQFQTLRIAVVESSTTANISDLKKQIDGDYNLLPKCGGACGSLMKKIDENMFFFLKSGEKTLPKHDAYVFSKSCHRATPGEYHDTCLQIDPELEYRPLINDSGSGTRDESVEVRAIAPCSWVAASGGAIHSFSSKISVSRPVTPLAVPMQRESWKRCPCLLSCTIEIMPTEDLFIKCKKAGGEVEVNLQKSHKTFSELAFVTSRLEIPNIFGNERWLECSNVLESDQDLVCSKCAPAKPKIKWRVVTKGKRAMFVPIEDGVEGAVYERALKDRPQPWMIRLAADSDSICLSIGCNAVSLVQKAFSLFPNKSRARQRMIEVAKSSSFCSLEWRVVPHVEMAVASFPKLTFSSNRHDQQAKQPPNFSKYPLRKEQLRSLTWMLEQETRSDPFFEEEVTEAVLPSLNWRAEGRARRPVLVRGGIIADEVGYGKTAISLGCIDSSDASAPEPEDGYISTKATLIIVPKHLMGQWPDEIKKFLGGKPVVVVIKDLTSMNSLTVSEVQNADMIIVSFSVLTNEKYFIRLARLAGTNPASFPRGTSGGRHFTAVYRETLDALRGRVSQIVSDCPNVFSSIEEDARAHSSLQAAHGSLRLDGKKAVYKSGKTTSQNAAATVKVDRSEVDPWSLKSSAVKKDYSKMKSPPLEAFCFKRVIVDEFTYLAKNERDRCLSVIREVQSSFRWLLSGTPNHSNFNDISSLASLLGIHLGVDEDLPGAKLNKKSFGDKEFTGLESLSCFMERPSLQWHLRRHQLAQRFLDFFVRQNVAEIDEIPFEEHECMVELSLAERSRYLELECHLGALGMNSKSAQKSKRKSTGDRENRMQKVLRESQSGEEALLKCSSSFDASASVSSIIRLRESQKIELENEMKSWLMAAFIQRQRIMDYQPTWTDAKASEKGEMMDALGVYLKEVDAHKTVPHGADKEVNLRIESIVRESKAAFDADPRSSLGDTFFPNENIDDDSNKAAKSKKKNKKGSKEEKTIDPSDLYAMKLALRNHMHGIRSLSKELCGRVRSLRYITKLNEYQQEKDICSCSCCEKKELNIGDVGLLSCCGHDGCLNCLRSYAGNGRCVDPDCSAQVSPPHVVCAKNFVGKSDSPGKFGRKMSAIGRKMSAILAQGDRAIVFYQFDDLSEKVKESLSFSGIRSVEVKGTVQQQIKTIAVFQKDKPSKDDPRVLLLKLDNEQSAGLNLTMLNHAVFVHPLLADSQQEYDAYETQAIGRIRRYGQKKTVHVWRFLARDTVDTTIFEQRSSRPIPPS